MRRKLFSEPFVCLTRQLGGMESLRWLTAGRPSPTTIFIGLVTIVLPLVWNWPRRAFARHFNSHPNWEKRILHRHSCFIMDIAITLMLARTWPLLGAACPIMPRSIL